MAGASPRLAALVDLLHSRVANLIARSWRGVELFVRQPHRTRNFLSVFDAATLGCWKTGRHAMPQALQGNLQSKVPDLLEELHLVRAGLRVTCDMGAARAPRRPSIGRRRQGQAPLPPAVRRDRLAVWQGCVRFRCGPPRRGRRDYCHELRLPHTPIRDVAFEAVHAEPSTLTHGMSSPLTMMIEDSSAKGFHSTQ